ncbi:MAG: sulfotransferase [Pirellulales bacterium]
MSTAAETPPRRKKPQVNPYPARSPRFWHGMRWGDWMKFWASHGFRAHPLRFPMALAITAVTPMNTVLGWMQSLLYGRRIANTTIDRPPVFIVGHWRTGTTLLHELMFLDERFGSPTTYQCFTPHHFLVSEWFLPRCTSFLMPRKRAMDNMPSGYERPQEDEFALLALAAPTPYFRMAYPSDPPPYMEFLDMRGVAPADLVRFEQAMEKFVKLITLRSGKRVLLKSPPHTGRIEVLSSLFPGAKFVHITRDPYSSFPSTLRLWYALDEAQGFTVVSDTDAEADRREEFVFASFERMYRGFEDQRQRLDPSAVCDVRYEDLVADPVGEVRRVYEQLDLGDYAGVEPKIAAYAAREKNYRTNVHNLDETLKTRIRERWSAYFEKYGYE